MLHRYSPVDCCTGVGGSVALLRRVSSPVDCCTGVSSPVDCCTGVVSPVDFCTGVGSPVDCCVGVGSPVSCCLMKVGLKTERKTSRAFQKQNQGFEVLILIFLSFYL